MIIFYDIKPELDKHGARVRLVRLLRKSGGIPVQRSAWIIPSITPELLRMIDEIRTLGGTVLISEWKPIPLSKLRGQQVEIGPTSVVGVLVHGPEVIDTGLAEKVLTILRNTGAVVDARIGGTMGRIAVLDAGLDNLIMTEKPMLPSEVLDEFGRKNVDLVILLNDSKSLEAGISLGMRIIENAKLIRLLRIPVIQIEGTGEKKGAIIPWSGNSQPLVQKLADSLRLEVKSPSVITRRVEKKGDKMYRTLMGVRPGEKILVNGYVVGESVSDDVILVTRNGILNEIIGGKLYARGVRKIGRIDLRKAVVKTLRTLRRTSPKETRFRRVKRKAEMILIERAEVVLDTATRASLVITIGDDTTMIASEILSRFGVPVLGVVDGDADGILERLSRDTGRTKDRHSVLIRVRPGMDDEAGKLIKDRIFRGKNVVKLKRNDVDAVRAKVVRLLNELVEVVIGGDRTENPPT